jgi:hypothetical protein
MMRLLFWRLKNMKHALGLLLAVIFTLSLLSLLSACGSRCSGDVYYDSDNSGANSETALLIGRWRTGGLIIEFIEGGAGTTTFSISGESGISTYEGEFSWVVSGSGISLDGDGLVTHELIRQLEGVNRFSVSENGQGLTLYAYGDPIHFGRMN